VVKEEGGGEGDETMAAARGRSRLDPARASYVHCSAATTLFSGGVGGLRGVTSFFLQFASRAGEGDRVTRDLNARQVGSLQRLMLLFQSLGPSLLSPPLCFFLLKS
jgi:hypothetical protein